MAIVNCLLLLLCLFCLLGICGFLLDQKKSLVAVALANAALLDAVAALQTHADGVQKAAVGLGVCVRELLPLATTANDVHQTLRTHLVALEGALQKTTTDLTTALARLDPARRRVLRETH